MEALQLAQMLADLSSLEAAREAAANALVTANKTVDEQEPKSDPETKPVKPETDQSSSTGARPTSSFYTVDKVGRRIPMTPPLSRTGSAVESGTGTPRREAYDDVSRASMLLSLHEIRAKLKEQDSTSLMKARERINALAARQQQARSFSEKSVPK